MKWEFVPKRTCGFVEFYQKISNNASRSVVEKLLIDSYISSKNYKEALILLEKSPENKLAYQKLLFRGLELYADRDYASINNV
jgi:hypothetical protein